MTPPSTAGSMEGAMSKAIPRFKHRAVGGRKCSGAILVGAIEPRLRPRRPRGVVTDPAPYMLLVQRLVIR